MPELVVVVLTADNEQRSLLPMLVDATGIARTAGALSTLSQNGYEPLLRRILELRADALVIDFSTGHSPYLLGLIEAAHAELPNLAIVAVGDMGQPHFIVSAMRAGAREFLERPTSTAHLLDAFARVTSSRRKLRGAARGRIITVANAKGGCGATTISINTALQLHARHGSTAVVDLAQLGHASLHLNLRSSFTVTDALCNLHRLDGALLEGYMSRHDSGVRLLAGASEPVSMESQGPELARLFDLLASHYRNVVIDFSNRLDAATRVVSELSDATLLIASTDVAALWSAAKAQDYLSSGGAHDRVRLVLNRFRKIPGFSERDVETATRAKLFWKLPNYFSAVSASIDQGQPVTNQNHSEISRSFAGLADALAKSVDETLKKPQPMMKIA